MGYLDIGTLMRQTGKLQRIRAGMGTMQRLKGTVSSGNPTVENLAVPWNLMAVAMVQKTITAQTISMDLTAITVAVWVKSAETKSDRGFIDGRDPGGDDTVLSLRYDAAGFEAGGNDVVKAGITTTGGIQRLESSNDVQTDSWQHLRLDMEQWQRAGTLHQR